MKVLYIMNKATKHPNYMFRCIRKDRIIPKVMSRNKISHKWLLNESFLGHCCSYDIWGSDDMIIWPWSIQTFLNDVMKCIPSMQSKDLTKFGLGIAVWEDFDLTWSWGKLLGGIILIMTNKNVWEFWFLPTTIIPCIIRTSQEDKSLILRLKN